MTRQPMLVVISSTTRRYSRSRASYCSCLETAAARAASASASARRARARQSPPPCPTPGIRPSHFSATRMCASIQPSGSPMSSSEWWWTARKSAVTTLRPAARACRQKSTS